MDTSMHTNKCTHLVTHLYTTPRHTHTIAHINSCIHMCTHMQPTVVQEHSIHSLTLTHSIHICALLCKTVNTCIILGQRWPSPKIGVPKKVVRHSLHNPPLVNYACCLTKQHLLLFREEGWIFLSSSGKEGRL